MEEEETAGSAQTDRPGGARTGDTMKDQPGKQQQQQGQAPRGRDGCQAASGGRLRANTMGLRSGASDAQQGDSKQGASDAEDGVAAVGSRPGRRAARRAASRSPPSRRRRSARTVLTSSAPRVTNVNFNVRVGTVVPRTVRIVPLPATLIEIEPTWRGYMYFVYQDKIIVVEPGTLRIVAVLDV